MILVNPREMTVSRRGKFPRGISLAKVDGKLTETNQRLEKVENRLEETNKRIRVIDQAIRKIPGLKPDGTP